MNVRIIQRLSRLLIGVLVAFAASLARADLPDIGLGAVDGPHQANIRTDLNLSALMPGQQAAVAITIDIAPGFHSPAHDPHSDSVRKFDIVVDDNPLVTFLPTNYPKGVAAPYPPFGTVYQYLGRQIAYIPFTVNAGAAAGPITITGKLKYQYCNDQTCFLVRGQNFSLTTQIVPAGSPVSAQNAALFAGFDPRVFAQLAAVGPASGNGGTSGGGTTTPANGAASANGGSSGVNASPGGDANGSGSADAGAPAATQIDVFGHTFSLASTGYGLAIVLALAIGVIFNLMPCVLPVLPLKAIGFYEVSQHNRAKCFGLGVVFSLGVIAVFAVLAVLLFVLPANHRLIWGEQFSSPWFVWGLIVPILVVMAAGMFGLFSIVLPPSIYSLTPRHDTITGNFLFGMLTAVLSTPCTAPMFVGLLAWAALQPKALGVATMLAVGVGMSLPYLILSAIPELARKIPRSGPWSEVVKQMMGFLLLAAAVYFGGGRIGVGTEFIWGVFAVIAAAGVFLVARTLQLSPRPVPIAVSSILAVAMIVVGFAVTTRLTIPSVHWEPYSAQTVADARESGRPVLIDFSANWCSNCLALEASVYNDPRAVAALKSHNVITIRADLTADDAPGWTLLKQLTTGGIPLTAIYPPGKPDPLQMTSLYTTQNLIDALDRVTSASPATDARADAGK